MATGFKQDLPPGNIALFDEPRLPTLMLSVNV